MTAAASISKILTKLCSRAVPSVCRQCVLPPPPLPFSTISSVAEPPSTSFSQTQENQKGRWSKWLLFLPGAFTFGLGTWQVVRRQEKIKMLDYRQTRLEMEPLKLNNVSPSNEEELEFRRMVCRGFFDERRSIYVGPRPRSISGVTENGYYIITPLMPIPNDPDSVQVPILVNRGWVPRSWRDKSLEEGDDEQASNTASSFGGGQEETSEGGSSWWRFWSKSNKSKIMEPEAPAFSPVQVVGVVRGSEKPSIFVPANDPTSFQWFYVDVPAIARASGLAESTIYVEDVNDNVNPGNPYPVPKDVKSLIRSSVMPQDHLNYMLTWYSLSAAVTFMAFKRITPKKIRR